MLASIKLSQVISTGEITHINKQESEAVMAEWSEIILKAEPSVGYISLDRSAHEYLGSIEMTFYAVSPDPIYASKLFWYDFNEIWFNHKSNSFTSHV